MPLGDHKFPVPTSRPTPAHPIGVRYRLGIRAVIQHVAEPDESDGRYECYGYLKLNKTQRWSIPSNEAQNFKRGVGESLDISGDTAHVQGGPFVFTAFNGTKKPTINLQFGLTDANTSGPRRIAVYLDALDLRRIADSKTEYRCRMGGGDALLYVKVEPVGFIYAPHLMPTPTPGRKPLKP